MVINDVSVIDDLPMFQMIMLWIMLGLICLMLVLWFVIYKEEQMIFYLIPSQVLLYSGADDYLLTMVESYYERLIIKPLIRDVLGDKFGKDLGLLMYEFIPFGLEEEEHAIELINRAARYTKKTDDVIFIRMFRASLNDC